ncbi:glycoside hydrolase family 30 protein [Chitinophaga eiseniae]|uniref:Glucosylceramidase n=1 Tax=Chitinophaga eiseniae TaxID=634771 RepID=A0A847SIB9_9BACT|nr:glycoside hydrolase family 30 beta sandwich domain-containing protein [Chitinophaga eiseniae]NLR81591.1 glucosylceramidase [Chitinophaga eiseniae]
MKRTGQFFLSLALLLGSYTNGNSQQKVPGISYWLTSPDKSIVLQQQPHTLLFSSVKKDIPVITVDDTRSFQGIDGFGFTLTGGSATLINQLPADQQDALLKELFLTKGNSIGISYLRLSIGASDLSASVFTYDDMPEGETDPELKHFTINEEKKDLIPVLKKIVALNPAIKILGSPWTPPAWMKTNESFIGGSLKPEYYSVYAQYFVRYIQAMKAAGITIDAITIQNEPLHPKNNPSMLMLAPDQAAFIRDHLGPAFKKARIKTKIILYDHNCDKPEYPISILQDAAANPYIDGSAFHLYGGTIDALSKVHDLFPGKHLYFTEQWSNGKGSFAEELTTNTTQLIIGATRNWAHNVLQWNLAADAQWNPHTDKGGCSQCLGAITIDGNAISRNSSYYVIGHASKFVPAGSVRIASDIPGKLDNVAFKTPAGKKILIVVNNDTLPQTFQISVRGQQAIASLNSGEVATFVW